MQNTIEIKQLSREEILKVKEAIWEDLSNEEEQVISPGETGRGHGRVCNCHKVAGLLTLKFGRNE